MVNKKTSFNKKKDTQNLKSVKIGDSVIVTDGDCPRCGDPGIVSRHFFKFSCKNKHQFHLCNHEKWTRVEDAS